MTAGNGEALDASVFGNDRVQFHVTLNAGNPGYVWILWYHLLEQHRLAWLRNDNALPFRRPDRNGLRVGEQVRYRATRPRTGLHLQRGIRIIIRSWWRISINYAARPVNHDSRR